MNIPETLLVTTRLQEKECDIQPPLPIHILDFDPFSNIPSRLRYAIEMLQDVKGSCCMPPITIPFWYREDIFVETTPISAGIPTDTVLFNVSSLIGEIPWAVSRCAREGTDNVYPLLQTSGFSVQR